MRGPDSIKSALVILVPEADPVVGPIRLQCDVAAQSGLAAHITILFPFLATDRLTSEQAARLRALFGAHPPVRVECGAVRTFPGVVYLAVEPRERCAALTRAVADAFPDCLPYGGAFADPVPHLTVGQGLSEGDSHDVVRQLESRLVGQRPIVSQATEVTWVFKRHGRWCVGERFALGGGAV